MRRTLFIACAVILALAGSAFAAASPYMKSRYYQLTQRVRVLATHTVEMPGETVAVLDWATLLKAGHTANICDDTTLELTSHTITHNCTCSGLCNECPENHSAISPKLTEHHQEGGWWEPREVHLGKADRHDRIDLWGRTEPSSTAGGDEIHVV